MNVDQLNSHLREFAATFEADSRVTRMVSSEDFSDLLSSLTRETSNAFRAISRIRETVEKLQQLRDEAWNTPLDDKEAKGAAT